jgi:hypothetical protein
MEQTAIFGPFLATMLLTLAVWLYMFARRIPFLQTSGIDSNALTPAKLAEISPPAISNPSDNLKNLFELPVLFYALVLYLYATGQVDGLHVGAAWVFAGFRALHSAVHCTFNLVLLRFVLYLVASLALWLMLLRAALAHLGS